MSYELTEKLRKLTPYEPVQGDYDIHLDANESFIELPDTLLREALDAVGRLPLNRYPDPFARDLRQVWGAYYGVDPRLITAGNGSDELISILMNCFFARGEKVVTVAPDFSMYGFYMALSELENVVCPKDPELRIDVDTLLAIINESGAKGVIFSNPCNPTSRGLSRAELRRLIAGTDALVILDEAYMDFWDQSLLPEVAEYDNLIILRTCSKALGLAAIRLGFAVANETLTRAFTAAKSPYNVGSITQTVGTVVLRHPEFLNDCRERLIASRTELYTFFQELADAGKLTRVFAPSTNFVFLESQHNDTLVKALAERSISIRNMGRYLRVTAGSPVENAALKAAATDILAEV